MKMNFNGKYQGNPVTGALVEDGKLYVNGMCSHEYIVMKLEIVDDVDPIMFKFDKGKKGRTYYKPVRNVRKAFDSMAKGAEAVGRFAMPVLSIEKVNE